MAPKPRKDVGIRALERIITRLESELQARGEELARAKRDLLTANESARINGAELARQSDSLRRQVEENAVLRGERDILKKALAVILK